ncbi:MAG: hypothetical protein ACT4TC_07240 [Myxococcaceae bacterium]
MSQPSPPEPRPPSRFAPGTPARFLVVDRQETVGAAMAAVLRRIVPCEVELRARLTAPDVHRDVDLLIVSYDELSLVERSLLTVYVRREKRGQLVIRSNGACRMDFPLLLEQHVLTNYVTEVSQRRVHEFGVTIQKLLGSEQSGVEPYFPVVRDRLSRQVASSVEIQAVLEEARAFVESKEVREWLAPRFVDVVDELLTNALYNAPVDPAGKPLWSTRARNVPITLPEQARVDVQLVSDGRRLGVSVTDPYGSLTREALLGHLAKRFRQGGNTLAARTEDGRGLGLITCLRSLTHLIVNLDRGRRTEMIGIVDSGISIKQHRQAGTWFNTFQSEREP